MTFRLFLITLTALVFGTVVRAADPQITARFDRQTVFEGDSVVLRVEISNTRLEAEPDFSSLESDFLIGQTGTNSSMSINNGRKEFRTEWNVLLEPRRTGEIHVPSLTIGPFRTEPLNLTVMSRPKGTGPQGRDVFLEVEVTPEQPYVHAQVLFVIRLYHAPSIMEGSLGEPPELEAVVERLGDDTDYRTVVDGQNYRVIERRYALFPERSGTLVLPEIRFQGRVADRSQRGGTGFNSLFSRGRLISVKSDPVTLEVLPRPSQFAGKDWLPAASFEIKEVWPNGEPDFRVGEPVTRTLVTEARGLLSAQLPEYQLDAPDDAKIYPDQPASQSRTDGVWVIGRREDRFAIVPVKAGPMALPEVRIPWWDTVNNRAEVAVVPARRFVVSPAAEGQVTTLPDNPGQVGKDVILPTLTSSSIAARDDIWRPLALAATGLWLVTMLLYLRQRQFTVNSSEAGKSQDVRSKTRGTKSHSLKKACLAGDAPAAASALLALPPEDGLQPPQNLGELARRLDDEALVEAVRALDRALYRQPSETWNGGGLWALARKGLRYRDDAPPISTDVIPPLYTQH